MLTVLDIMIKPQIIQIEKHQNNTTTKLLNQNNMNNEVKGILHVKGQTQQRSEKFSTRSFTIKTNEDKYEQFITFELLNDRTDMIDPFGVGEEITVSFNLKGREWTSPQGEVKYFNTLEAWKVQGIF